MKLPYIKIGVNGAFAVEGVLNTIRAEKSKNNMSVALKGLHFKKDKGQESGILYQPIDDNMPLSAVEHFRRDISKVKGAVFTELVYEDISLKQELARRYSL